MWQYLEGRELRVEPAFSLTQRVLTQRVLTQRVIAQRVIAQRVLTQSACCCMMFVSPANVVVEFAAITIRKNAAYVV